MCPNWCSCDLRVNGKKKDLERFRKYGKKCFYSAIDREDEALRTINFVPYPKPLMDYYELLSKIEKTKDRKEKKRLMALRKIAYGGEEKDEKKAFTSFEDLDKIAGCNVFDYCCMNWGTKWGICHSQLLEKGKSFLLYTFDTAWSPPLPVIFTMSEKFPTLRFTLNYYEQGNGFKGRFILEDKEVIRNDYNNNYKGGRGG
jgi:hypothetical protein